MCLSHGFELSLPSACRASHSACLKSSEYVKAHGQLDLIVEPGEGQDPQEALEDRLQSIVSLLFAGEGKDSASSEEGECIPATKEDMEVNQTLPKYSKWQLELLNG